MYIATSDDDDLKQGDIFFEFPLLLHKLTAVTVVTAEGPHGGSDVTGPDFDSNADLDVVGLLVRAPVIIVSQSCDAARDNCLTVARIRPITFAESGFEQKTPRNKVDYIRKLRDMNGFFYLTENPPGLSGKCVVVFDEFFPARREDLLAMQRLRRIRLSPEALQHFQDKLSRFFSRYAFNDRYMLRPDELGHYDQIVAEGERRYREKQAAQDSAR